MVTTERRTSRDKLTGFLTDVRHAEPVLDSPGQVIGYGISEVHVRAALRESQAPAVRWMYGWASNIGALGDPSQFVSIAQSHIKVALGVKRSSTVAINVTGLGAITEALSYPSVRKSETLNVVVSRVKQAVRDETELNGMMALLRSSLQMNWRGAMLRRLEGPVMWSAGKVLVTVTEGTEAIPAGAVDATIPKKIIMVSVGGVNVDKGELEKADLLLEGVMRRVVADAQ